MSGDFWHFQITRSKNIAIFDRNDLYELPNSEDFQTAVDHDPKVGHN